MFKSFKWLMMIGVVAGGWYFFNHFRIQGFDSVKIQPRESGAGEVGENGQGRPKTDSEQLTKKTIWIASANFGPLDRSKVGRPQIATRLSQILRKFDVIALQDIQARDQGLLVELLEQVNAEGRRYNFATPPNVGRDVVRQYGAFVFDAETVQIDRSTVVSVDNREGQFRHPPLVAAFRTRGPAPSEAFTFTLVNVHTPADRTALELDLLATVYRAVRDDGRNEDDIILLGDIEADEEHLGELARLPNLNCAISAMPTTTRGTRIADNILLDCRATTEYTRRSGVMDLMREFDLSAREATEISDHLPVWAEFSVYEAGQAGHVSR